MICDFEKFPINYYLYIDKIQHAFYNIDSSIYEI